MTDSELMQRAGAVLLATRSAAETRRAALETAGFALRVAPGGAAALARLQADWDIAVVVVDVADVTPALLNRLRAARAPRLIALVDAAGADAAGLALDANLAAFLPDDVDDAKLIAAIGTALDGAKQYGVAEMSDRSAAQLGALSAEVERIAAALATIAAGERRVSGGGALPVTAVQVRAIIKARRLRDRFLPAELFQDPAWDMLLDLIAARLEGKPVSVSSLCIAAAVPTTTGLRWIRTLCDSGMFVRQLDPNDARRAFIALAEPTAQAMLDYLASLRGEGPVI